MTEDIVILHYIMLVAPDINASEKLPPVISVPAAEPRAAQGGPQRILPPMLRTALTMNVKIPP